MDGSGCGAVLPGAGDDGAGPGCGATRNAIVSLLPPAFAPGRTARIVVVPWSRRGSSSGTARMVTVPSERGAPSPSAGVPASSRCCGSPPCRSSGEPQATCRSCSPKPFCLAVSACQAEAGASVPEDGPPDSPSSSRKTGPVSSTAGVGAGAGAGAWAAAPGGGAGSASPSAGAGRLVPGTHAAPFQYRM